MPTKILSRAAFFVVVLVALVRPFRDSASADWPMSRFDPQRSGASPQNLPKQLHLQWSREFAPLDPAWPDQAKMQFDIAYDPIVLGQTLILASSRHDWVMALDVSTGQEKWRFFAEGPVRFAPVGWQGKIYFASDDGFLYCLDADTGGFLWKHRGGPSDRKILGNDRLISTWPARGAPVIVDGTVYFAASIWPFMGTFVHALDARTGKLVWTNDGDGSVYIKQPHNADSFAGVAPQGPLVAVGDNLLVPGGRSVPACLDRKSGKMLRFQLGENGKRGGGSDVCANDTHFFNGGAVFDLFTQEYLAQIGTQVVITPEYVFAIAGGSCRAYETRPAFTDIANTFDRLGYATHASRWHKDEVASCRISAGDSLIRSGSRLYAGGKNRIEAIDLDMDHRQMKVGWHTDVEGNIVRLLTGANRLFAVAREGRLLCFGADKLQPAIIRRQTSGPAESDDSWPQKAQQVLKATHVNEGYCIALGVGSGRLIDELIRHSKLQILVLEPEASKVLALRNKCVAEDCKRINVCHGDPTGFAFPPYLASLVVSEEPAAFGIQARELLAWLYPTIRPYGGAACFFDSPETRNLAKAANELSLPKARLREVNELLVLTREGALPGAADWTHEHADAANTRVSLDGLVKAPLGLLWFGGPSHEGMLPRHGHGPQPQVIDGRMIIEGLDMIRAIDIYTGRLLWETPLTGVGSFYDNLAHQPGANSRGSNYVSTSDGIYVAIGRQCVRLDPADGKVIGEFRMPPLPNTTASPRWGYLNVVGDYLIGGADPLLDPKLLPANRDNPLGAAVNALRSFKGFNDNLSASMHLVVMDRHTGAVRWSAAARCGFRHNATCIGNGRLYAIDRLSGEQLGKYKRRGEEPPFPARLVVFDLATGKELWNTQTDVFGTWISFSAKHDVLVESGRGGRDTLSDEPDGMRAYGARDGAVLWHNKSYLGPAMIHGDAILQGQGGCDLLTGALKMRADPLTGQSVPWKWMRNYGCNTPAASEHLMTFRSGAAGYFDLGNDGGTGNFGGFRSSCTNNLIVAGGVLTAPEYTRTCTCAYQNQTSVAFVHMPEAEMWTSFGVKEVKGSIKRLGLNFGAPGDRKASDGTLWIEHPSVAGLSPVVQVSAAPADVAYFRRHSSVVPDKHGWITSSGAKGLKELRVKLTNGETEKYTVRLYFAEPEDVKAKQRLFDVELQGRLVAKTLDIVEEAGGRFRTLVKEFHGVEVRGDLLVRLTPIARAPIRTTVLCGLEIISEEKK